MKFEFKCPNCGGEGRSTCMVWIGGPFRNIEVRGIFNRKYVLERVCDDCGTYFEVFLTREQAIEFERQEERKYRTPVGTVEITE